MDLPWCSSDLLIKILEREGFIPAKRTNPQAKRKGGSHCSYVKPLPEGGKLIAIVVLNRKEMPQGTLKGILRQAGMTHERYCELHQDCK